jgi:hypothetical protein
MSRLYDGRASVPLWYTSTVMGHWSPRVPVEDIEELTSSKSRRESRLRDFVAPERRVPRPSSLPGPRIVLRKPETISIEEMGRYLRNTSHRLGQSGQEAPAPEGERPQVSEDEVRRLLEQATDVIHRQLQVLLRRGNGSLGDDARQDLLAHIVRLYTMRDIGKGFSTLVHTMWTILESQDTPVDADCLRLFRDTLERLYAEPRMPYARARALRKDLKRAELPVENREIRKLLVDAIIASRA